MQVARDPRTLALDCQSDERLLLRLELPSTVGQLGGRPGAAVAARSPPHQGGSVPIRISRFGASANPMYTWIATDSTRVAGHAGQLLRVGAAG